MVFPIKIMLWVYIVAHLAKALLTGAQFEGDLGEILALWAEISRPILVSGRSGSLPKKTIDKL